MKNRLKSLFLNSNQNLKFQNLDFGTGSNNDTLGPVPSPAPDNATPVILEEVEKKFEKLIFESVILRDAMKNSVLQP